MVQRLDGEFAQWHNRRKRRSGAFWEDRYHCTLVDGGEHAFNCIRYIDLNMVRAGVVDHPKDWRWCGHDELVGNRRRYRLLDFVRVEVAGHGAGRIPDPLRDRHRSHLKALGGRLRRWC